MYKHPGLIAVTKLQMESNELIKKEASEENEFLENGEILENEEAKASVAAGESTDNENLTLANEAESLPEALTGHLPDADLQTVLTVDSELDDNQEISSVPEEPKISENTVVNVDIPEPVTKINEVTETVLIDQIVQASDVPDDDDDDLFSDIEPDSHAIPIHDYSSYSKIQLINTLRKILAEGTFEEIRSTCGSN